MHFFFLVSTLAAVLLVKNPAVVDASCCCCCNKCCCTPCCNPPLLIVSNFKILLNYFKNSLHYRNFLEPAHVAADAVARVAVARVSRDDFTVVIWRLSPLNKKAIDFSGCCGGGGGRRKREAFKKLPSGMPCSSVSKCHQTEGPNCNCRVGQTPADCLHFAAHKQSTVIRATRSEIKPHNICNNV